jgi:flagellar basal-body rod protein FlgC
MDLMQTMKISMGGMQAQSARMRIVAENIANADSVQNAAGTGPYRAKQIYFQTVLNKATGAAEVRVAKVADDLKTPLSAVYNPGHDLADARGFVQMPNVNSTLENINMKEAQRSYEANMAAIDTARDMATRTLDMLR